MNDLEKLTRRIETFDTDMAAMKATWADSHSVSKQILATTERLVLQLRRLVETLESADPTR